MKTKSGLRPNCREIGALIYKREALFLEPNTTSTCTRNESRGGLMACDNSNESRGVRDESGNIMVGRVLGRVPGAWYE